MSVPDLIPLLQTLVRIPSPNPPGDTVNIAECLRGILADQQVADVRLLAPPDKPEAQSVIATVGSGQPMIMLHAHIDTVPVAEEEAKRWSVDPYAAAIRDG